MPKLSVENNLQEFTRKTFLPFSLPGIDEKDISGVVEVLKSGWITTGPKCDAFEKAFAEYLEKAKEENLMISIVDLHI